MSVLVLGATGLAGSAIMREAQSAGLRVVGSSSAEVDLRDRKATFSFIHDRNPEVVVIAAAKVGGIYANSHFPVDFLSTNLLIQTNVLDACHSAEVERVVFLGSSCIYPRDSKSPIREESLMSGPLETTNSAYAIAKISGIELIRAYRQQYGHNWISLMPTNLYGPGDNFDLLTSHVLPALIRRFSDAVEFQTEEVRLWGTGNPRREFLHSEDFARAVLLCMNKYDHELPLNVGSGQDYTINHVASIVSEVAGFTGTISWDKSKPDGVSQKLLDSTKISSLGFSPQIDLYSGIEKTFAWFRDNWKHESSVRL
jgi:GDP-L-fucose synthase